MKLEMMNKSLGKFISLAIPSIQSTVLGITGSLLFATSTHATETHIESHDTVPPVPEEFLNFIESGDYPTDPLDPRYESLWVAGIDLAKLMSI